MEPDPIGAAAVNEEPPYLVSAPLRQRLDLVHHLLEFGNRTVLIEGEQGSGRTRMLEAACAEAEAAWTVLQPEAGDAGSAADLLGFLARGLDLDAEREAAGASEVEREIARLLARMDADHEICLVAFDDAESLPDDVLELLFRLTHPADDSGHLRVMLTADRTSGLVERVQARTPEPARVHVVDIPELKPEQVTELAELFRRSLPDAATIEPEDAASVASRAGGNPGRVLAALRAAVEMQAAVVPAPRERVPIAPQARVLGLVVLAAAAVGIAVLTREPPPPTTTTIEVGLPPGAGGTASPNGVEGGPGAPQPASAAPRANAAGPPAVDGDDGATLGPEPPLSDAAPGAPGPGEPKSPDSVSPVEASPETAITEAQSPERGRRGPAAPAPDGRPGTAAPTAAVSPGRPVQPPAVAGTPPPTPPAPPTAVADSPAAPASPRPAEARPAAAAPEPTPRSPPATSVQKASQSVYSAEWVLTQDGRSYVIQLFGVRERAAAVRFLRDNATGLPGAVIELSHESAPWFVVVLGHFRDREGALEAIRTLPPGLSRFKPWARPVHSLKQ